MGRRTAWRSVQPHTVTFLEQRVRPFLGEQRRSRRDLALERNADEPRKECGATRRERPVRPNLTHQQVEEERRVVQRELTLIAADPGKRGLRVLGRVVPEELSDLISGERLYFGLGHQHFRAAQTGTDIERP